MCNGETNFFACHLFAAQLDEVEKAAAHHEMLKGEVVKATRERNQAFEEYMEWLKDFKAICRVALPGSQKLEKLGIKVRS